MGSALIRAVKSEQANPHISVLEARGGLSFISQLTLLHFCDTFPALLRGNFNAASGMIQTRLIHDPKYFKKERNIP